ncbi:hypothetical protein [Paraburkholderia sp.]|uniref:hypothetical protein n=1 Tax=Paraburkholderia sp. TaxID=1926495 RepID=UPI00286F5297|nr:hypothetical protein [Paraburkholderia sp.]
MSLIDRTGIFTGTPIRCVASMLDCARQGAKAAVTANVSATRHTLDAGDDKGPDMEVSCC